VATHIVNQTSYTTATSPTNTFVKFSESVLFTRTPRFADTNSTKFLPPVQSHVFDEDAAILASGEPRFSMQIAIGTLGVQEQE
jgi:hypothetical protein